MRVEDLLLRVLNYSKSKVDQTEVLYIGQKSALTRFANNFIHQNVSEKDATISLRVIIGKKIGSASTNRLDERSLKQTVDKALEIAKTQKETLHPKSLPTQAKYANLNTFIELTAKCTPQERAEAVSEIIALAQKNKVMASGAFSTNAMDLAIANSLGLQAHQMLTEAKLNLVVTGEGEASGYASHLSRDVAVIDPRALAEEAIKKCLQAKDPISLKAGDYAVILEPYAVGDLVVLLGSMGLGALALQEGRSFMCGKLGQNIAGENITIWDDGLDPLGMPMSFDFEGVPKRKVVLIENGIAKGVVYDSYTASKEGKSSTGHGLPAPNTSGPFPLHLFMKAGDSSIEEMIASTERGIYVTRFHYTNPVDVASTTITGMTRDASFLIENGRIKQPLKDLRVNQSVLKALSRVSLVSKETRLVEASRFPGWVRVPAIKVDKFTFTGTT